MNNKIDSYNIFLVLNLFYLCHLITIAEEPFAHVITGFPPDLNIVKPDSDVRFYAMYADVETSCNTVYQILVNYRQDNTSLQNLEYLALRTYLMCSY